MKVKPSLPSGTRDFLPQEVAKRNHIFGVIKSVFEKYGFQQIETPVLENLTTLTGKYGEEGDQLLFKVLNSGNPFEKLLSQDIETIRSIYNFKHPANPLLPLPEIIHFTPEGNLEPLFNYVPVIQKLADRGLRYDLTVPLARYVVQHQGDLVFPFKRYHLAPVWRADRPQKGRYREFYQCDADVIGSNSLLNEVELTEIYLEVFEKLGLDVKIKINSRKLLAGISEWFNDSVKDATLDMSDEERKEYSNYLMTIIVATVVLASLDKIDKIGVDGVKKELEKTFPSKAVNKLDELFKIQGSNHVQINDAKKLLEKYADANEGIAEIEFILKHFLKSDAKILFDSSLARGLNYYTGMIWEVVLDKTVEANKNISIGSLGGGGRYGNLTEMFGGINMSGVGISFGIERIYDVMEELNLFPTTITQGVKVLLVPREESLEDFTFSQVQKLREQGISAEIFLGNVKKQKQFTYAEQKHIAYLIEVGENEQQSGLFRLRNAVTREMENDLSIEKIIEKLK